MQIQDKFPDLEFISPKSKESISGKIYLGFFLALCLFLSFIFGNLFLTIIVAICSLFIMLSQDSNLDGLHVKIIKKGIAVGDVFFAYSEISSFQIVEDIFGSGEDYLKLSFWNYMNPHMYIRLPEDVQKEIVYAIISARLSENESPLGFLEILYLRFFG